MLGIDVHPDVYHELEESRSWYEARAENLGIDFLDEVDRAIDAVCRAPQTWPWHEKELGVRRFLVHRFPYAVVYRHTSAAIQVIAVMHLHRHPDYWKHRMSHWSDDDDAQ